MKSEKLGELLLDGLVVTQNYLLVVQDGVHVYLQLVHVLTDGDLVFMGLIPIRIELCGQVMDLVLECSRRTDMVLLIGWWGGVRVGWMTALPLPGHLLVSHT